MNKKRKGLVGKKAFEAMGRRHTSLCLPRMFYDFYKWPQWAQQAFMRGKMLQHPNRIKNHDTNTMD